MSLSRGLLPILEVSIEKKKVASHLQKKNARGTNILRNQLLPLVLCPVSQCLVSEQATGSRSTSKSCSFPLLLRRNNNGFVKVPCPAAISINSFLDLKMPLKKSSIRNSLLELLKGVSHIVLMPSLLSRISQCRLLKSS